MLFARAASRARFETLFELCRLMVPSTRAIGCNVRDSMKLNSQLNILKTPQQGYGVKTAQSTVATFEVNHEIGQGVNAFQRHGVIDGGAHAAYHTVTFQRMQTCGEGLFQKTLSVLSVRQLERHVHAGTVGFRHIVTIEITFINDAVQQFSFAD